MHQHDKVMTTSGPTPYFSHRTMHRAQLPNAILRLYDSTAWASAKVALDVSDSLTSFTQLIFSQDKETLVDKQQHLKQYRSSFSSEPAAKFSAKGCHTVTLHKCSHFFSLTDRTPRTQLWQFRTSLFLLICFHKFDWSLVGHTTSPCTSAIYLKATQSTYTQYFIWGNAQMITQQINPCSRDT